MFIYLILKNPAVRGFHFFFFCELSLHLLNDPFKSAKVNHGQFSQHFAIQFNLVVFQSFDESRILKVCFCLGQTSINSKNPQFSEVALAQFSTNISILTSMKQSFFGSFEKSVVGATKAFGKF